MIGLLRRSARGVCASSTLWRACRRQLEHRPRTHDQIFAGACASSSQAELRDLLSAFPSLSRLRCFGSDAQPAPAPASSASAAAAADVGVVLEEDDDDDDDAAAPVGIGRMFQRKEPVPTSPRERTHAPMTQEAMRRQILARLSEMGKARECITLAELLCMCNQVGDASTATDVEEFVRSLEGSGHILIFRNRVILHPEKVSEVLHRFMPLPLAPGDDPRKAELEQLHKEKEEIDMIAHRQVHKMLCLGLIVLSIQFMFFFRLTFWDLSWDVIEPVMFFLTCASITASFLFFLVTSRDPSFRGIMHAIFLSKQRKLMMRRNFNMARFKELERQCCKLCGQDEDDVRI